MRTRVMCAGVIPVWCAVLSFTATSVMSPGAAAEMPSPDMAEIQPPEDVSDEAVVGLPPGMAARMAGARPGGAKKPDFPKFDVVAKDYKKVVSTADGARSLYTVWTRKKDGQVLAELPRSFEKQKLFIAFTVAGGTPTAGVQTADMYAYWKRFDKRLALIEPNFAVRTTGDLESKKGHERVFTDRVLLDIPIVTMGPGGGPVIDMDALLLGTSNPYFRSRGSNPALATVAKAKAFPKNVELAFELPLAGGRIGRLHYSISVLPGSTGYKPRLADARVGFFTTTYRDIGHPSKDTPWVRYVNRWKLEKADPKLKVSPPKQPIIFYMEHTTPVRYRRWVRDGILEWNKAFEKVGITGAVEVYQQDARTGAHMEKDPEDARYNFVLWTNANMGFAIGPSRVDPRTGQILDADIVMDEGFITSWVNAWRDVIPETAMLNFGPETLSWLQTRPQWDPRVRLAAPTERPARLRELQVAAAMHGQNYGGHPAALADPTRLGDDRYDGLYGRISQVNGRCECASGVGMELALFRLAPDLLIELAARGDKDGKGKGKGKKGGKGKKNGDEKDDDDADADADADADEKDNGQKLDGVPEWFVGPMLKSIVMHEVGHTIGLRHNFKASTVYGLDEINSAAHEGMAITGSVMDYNPININMDDGEKQGPYTMSTIGPYDYWAIEYGYSFARDLKPILARVAEDGLIYGTDEDSFSSDPRARVFDMGSDPLEYAESQMRLVTELREHIMERMVKDGQSWSKARRGYQLLLGRHLGSIGIAANWVGGRYSYRDLKGDPGSRKPVAPVPADMQRRALEFVMANAFDDEAFGLTPDLLAHMTVDKWWDEGGFSTIFEDPAWPVHDRILGIQATALTMLMNPTTLNRVYDNEFMTPEDEDALTLPELVWGLADEVWAELDDTGRGSFTAREPMISSLRRNLQREHLERLIDLTFPNDRFGAAAKPVSNLAMFKLRELEGKIAKLTDETPSSTRRKRNGKRASRGLDPYTLAHLAEAQVRINRALDAQYIYNTDDIGGGGGLPAFFFGREEAETTER